jgi:hypothetical protein
MREASQAKIIRTLARLNLCSGLGKKKLESDSMNITAETEMFLQWAWNSFKLATG